MAKVARLSDGQHVTVKTVSMDPKAFLLTNLTTKAEVDYLSAMVSHYGAEDSPASTDIRRRVSFRGAPYLYADVVFERVFKRIKEIVRSEKQFSEPEVFKVMTPVEKTKLYAVDEIYHEFGHSQNRQKGVIIMWLNFVGENKKADIFLPVRHLLFV
jgi:hypothetical protein